MHFATSERMTGPDAQTRDNNTMHTELRVARLFPLARLSPRPGDRCRYPALMFCSTQYRIFLRGKQSEIKIHINETVHDIGNCLGLRLLDSSVHKRRRSFQS